MASSYRSPKYTLHRVQSEAPEGAAAPIAPAWLRACENVTNKHIAAAIPILIFYLTFLLGDLIGSWLI